MVRCVGESNREGGRRFPCWMPIHKTVIRRSATTNAAWRVLAIDKVFLHFGLIIQNWIEHSLLCLASNQIHFQVPFAKSPLGVITKFVVTIRNWLQKQSSRGLRKTDEATNRCSIPSSYKRHKTGSFTSIRLRCNPRIDHVDLYPWALDDPLNISISITSFE